jgi:hypothetical protein
MSKDDTYSQPVSIQPSSRTTHSPPRPARSYEDLNPAHFLSANPVGQSAVKRNSAAQVDSFVSQQAGSQPYCGLKPSESRRYRIVIRFTAAERSRIVGQSLDARLTVSQFVRLSLLNNPRLDPERNRLLHRINYQLSRHGTNLNQIAKHLNMATISPDQAAHAVAVLRQDYSDAYKAVCTALANGRKYDQQQ